MASVIILGDMPGASHLASLFPRTDMKGDTPWITGNIFPHGLLLKPL